MNLDWNSSSANLVRNVILDPGYEQDILCEHEVECETDMLDESEQDTVPDQIVEGPNSGTNESQKGLEPVITRRSIRKFILLHG